MPANRFTAIAPVLVVQACKNQITRFRVRVVLLVVFNGLLMNRKPGGTVRMGHLRNATVFIFLKKPHPCHCWQDWGYCVPDGVDLLLLRSRPDKVHRPNATQLHQVMRF